MPYDFETALSNIEKQRNGLPPEPTPPVSAPANPELDRLGVNLQRAASANPMEEAKRRKLSGELGTPAAILPPTAQAEEQAFLRNTKAQDIMAKYPSLAKWAQNPDYAAVAGKDIVTLGEIESTAQGLPTLAGDAAQIGKNLAGSAAAAFPNANAAVWSFVQAAGAILSHNVTKPLADNIGSPDVGEMLRSTAADYRNQQLGLAKDLRPNQSGLSVLERGVYSGVESAATSLMTLPLSVASGSPVPTLAALSGITAGNALGEATDKGLPLNEALVHATKQGLIEYGTELFPMGNLLKNLTGKTGLVKTAKEFLIREGIGEQVATHLQDLDKWATLNPEKPFSEYVAERPEAALETLIATAVGGSIQVGGAKAVAKGMETIQRSLATDMGRAQRAEENHLTIQQLGEMAGKHPLRERDPQAFHDFIHTMSDDGNLSDVYIDGKTLENVLNQSGVNTEEIARKMPEVAQQLGEAAKTNGEVRISLADYATYVAGTDVEKGIIDHLRASPDGLTYTEAQQFYQGQKEDLTKQAATLMADVGTSGEFKADVQTVHDTILEQMNKAGRFTPEVNAAYAVPFREFYAVNAARMGMTPSELYKQLPLKFAPMNAGDVLNQGDDHINTPEFKEWFGDSKIVDEEGKPLTVYHGTSGDHTEFSEQYAGSVSSGVGKGFWFSKSREYAWEYAENAAGIRGGDPDIRSLYLSVKNPLVVEFDDYGKAIVQGTVMDWTSNNDAVKYALKNGHDGIDWVTGSFTDDPSITVFKPEQIKSAIGNSGKFNPNDPNILNQSVFHGTPHVWAPEPGFPHGRPRLDKMGTGEGAQAFGWGWYSAENQGVATDYRNTLADTAYSYTIDGEFQFNSPDYSDPRQMAISVLANGEKVEAVKERLEDNRSDPAWVKQFVAEAKKLNGKKVEFKTDTSGSLYSLDIPDSVLPHLLDWDKPLSEQTPEVRKGINDLLTLDGVESYTTKEGEHIYLAFGSESGMTGQEFYKRLSRDKGGSKQASSDLAFAGVVGNRYLDGGSRADGKGTYNYVLWDQPTIDKVALLERNGEKLDAMRELAQSGVVPQTETPQFKSWFGDSKVVGKDGRPKVMYRALDEEYQEGRGRQFWADDTNVSNAYAFSDLFDQPNTVPAFLSIKNPYIMASDSDADTLAGWLDFGDWGAYYELADHEGLENALRSRGYDGLILDGNDVVGSISHKTYVTFDDDQVKSAVGNNGNFSGDSILEQNNRAGYNPDTFTISLLKGADLSSTLHEGGHFYLEALAELAGRPDAPQQIKDDFRKTLDWFGITGNENLEAGARGQDLGQEAYQGEHSAPGPDGGAPLHDVTGDIYPDDFYGPNGLQYYGTGEDVADRESMSVIRSVRGKPNAKVKIYRAVPHDKSPAEKIEELEAQKKEFLRRGKWPDDNFTDGSKWYEFASREIERLKSDTSEPLRITKINPGDWVTLSRSYAKGHGVGALNGKYKIITQTVPASTLFTNGDSLNEFGYSPESSKTLAQGGEPGTPGDLPPGRTPEEVWNSMSLDQKRPYHEQWAQSFERYMIEGKAPTTEMQPVFARFRAWMLNVYKSLENFLKQNPLAGKLNDEVRGIFDRMIAAEESIKATEAVRGYVPLFKSAEEAGVTAKQWSDYVAQGEAATDTAIDDMTARSLRDMKWLSNAKERVIKELQNEAKAKRKAVEAEVTREVMAEPIEVARKFLKTGEMVDPQTGDDIKAEAGFKLDSKAVAELFPESGPVTLDKSKLRGMTATDGLSPDLAAQMFGFASGEALILELSNGESAKSKIEGTTDQRMLERFGELSSEEDIERAAEAAIHNEARAKFMATGLKILSKSPISASALSKAAKAAAENTIASRKVRDLRPNQYERAETKANKEALQLAAKDPKGAVIAQRAALLNNRLAKASGEAVKEVEKILRYVAKFETEGTRKAINIDYLEQIEDLLRPFDFRKGQTLKQIDKRQSLADWISEQEAMGFEPVIDAALMDEMKLKSYKNMTVEELRGLVDSIKQIEHLGRLKNKLLLAKDQREFDEIVLEGLQAIEDNANRTVEERSTPTDAVGVAGKWWRQMTADHRKFASIMREMDGGKDNGFMFNRFLRPMNESGDSETAMKSDATDALAKLFKQISTNPVPGNLYAKKRVVPGTNLSMTHEQRIMFAMNWGNEGNRQRLLDGGLSGNRALSQPQAKAILDTLTQSEWDFVQGVWDYIGTYRDQVAALERRITGIEPKWIDATPVQTKYGTYKGGYFPVKYDTELSTRSESLEAANDLRMGMKGAFNSSATRSGFTKARADAVMNRPILLSYNAISQHVSEVTHRLAWQEWLIDTNRLLKALDNPIREHYGAEILRTLRDTVVDIAAGDAPAKNGTETAINRLRVGSTIVGMGWRVTTALLQPSGLAQSWVRVGGKYIARGVYQFSKSPITSGEFVNARSKMMVDRGKTMQREINEVLNTVRAGDKISAFKASYFSMIGKMQRMVDIPTWLGAYEKATDQLNLQNAATADERTAIEEQAAALADQAVLDSQSGGQLKDLAKVQRGSPLQKIFTNFYSYFSATYNLNVEAVRRTSFKSPSQVAMLATDMVLLNSVPVLFSVALKELLKGECGDDLECLGKKLGHEQLGFLFGQMVLLREMGVAIDVAAGGQGFGYQGPAGLRFFADLYKTGQQANQGDADIAFFKSANNVAGAILHYPAGQINATMEGIMAIEEGKVEGMGILPALIVGPPKK